MDMWWHMLEPELEAGVIDETGEVVGDELDWKRRYPESPAV